MVKLNILESDGEVPKADIRECDGEAPKGSLHDVRVKREVNRGQQSGLQRRDFRGDQQVVQRLAGNVDRSWAQRPYQDLEDDIRSITVAVVAIDGGVILDGDKEGLEGVGLGGAQPGLVKVLLVAGDWGR